MNRRRGDKGRRARPEVRDDGGREVELAITGLGARGDGLAHLDGRPVFVPYAAPGDRVRARLVAERGDGIAAAMLDLVAPSALRVAPPCPHFGRCGGCALQHIEDGAYAAWKQGLVREALAPRGLAGSEVADLVRIPPGTRRRAAFRAVGTGGKMARLGYSERAAHRLVDLDACPILLPEIVAALPALKRALGGILAPNERIWVALTATRAGLDLLLTADVEPGLERLERLGAYAAHAGLARLVWRSGRGGDQPVAIAAAPHAAFDGLRVPLPPGAFLQPSAGGEAVLRDLVRGVVGDAEWIADLYAGLGTFAAPLASAGARVSAFEGDRAAAAALAGAARGLNGRLTVARRDLASRPLTPEELRPFHAAVLDPPRAGAAAQAAMLARSAVARIAYVSCNPASFVRDARVLVDGGYHLARITPVDQFPWSAHLELVGAFRRD